MRLVSDKVPVHEIKKNISSVFSISIRFLMFLQNVTGKVLNGTNTETIKMEEEEKIFAYTLADLMMSITIMLLILGIKVIWYGFACFNIYVVYRRTEKRIPYFDEIKVGPVWSWIHNIVQLLLLSVIKIKLLIIVMFCQIVWTIKLKFVTLWHLTSKHQPFTSRNLYYRINVLIV